MKVCIAEKPSVAREIANVIGAKSRKDGYFEGNGYAVTWTFGHFCSLYAPDEYKPSWKRWDLNTLPMLPERFETRLINDSGVKKQFKVIKSLFQKASVVINCGDAGQEGELIQRWVINEANYTGPSQRLWISSLTNEAIREGFGKLRPAKEFDRLYYAGSARAIGDWLLGMNATRLYTLKYGGYKQVLSIGRVQTPTLAMIVARHKEIENFVSSPFWELQTIYRATTFNRVKGRFEQKEKGETILDKIKDSDFTIVSATRKEGKEYAPKLFDLTSLQVFCNKRYSYSADQTLKLVQKLYEMKVVTYPRVDTTYLPEDQYPKIKGILTGMKSYSKFTATVLSKPIPKSKRVFDNKKVTDHHAIIPTGKESHLTGGLLNVYDAISRRFIANFYPICKVANTTVIGKVEEEEFKANGKEILEPGWRVLFPKAKKKKDQDSDEKEADEDKILPSFQAGESGPHSPKLIEKKTQPPKYYTEATLLRAMETAGKSVDDEELRDLMKANGIGRPSTRAAIIETLFKRKYIKRRKKIILPTDLGIQLIDTINNKLLKSVELTGQWEKLLKDIEAGTYNPKAFINHMKKMVDSLVTEVRMEKAKAFVAPSTSTSTSISSRSKAKGRKKTKPSKAKKSIHELNCPKCKKGSLLKGKSAYGCSQWKTGCSFTLPFTIFEKKMSDNQLKRLVEKGCTTNLKGFSHLGTKVSGLVRFDESFQLVLELPKTKSQPQPKEILPSCPKCKKGQIMRGKTAYGCSEWKNGCDFKFKFEDIKAKAKGKKLTKELVLQIISS
ncbi:MAG: DNA topoisomerase 3 [Saprospiraceae bacterium]|nr:DNA topoisomerase 3 [Saprospiraceae bacterium]